MAIGLLLVLAGLVVGSQFVTNPEDLGKRFARAQKLMALGDSAVALAQFEQVGAGEAARRMLESIAPTQPQYAYAQLELAQLYVEAGKAD